MTLPREYSRVLEMAFETFSRHWATQMVASLRTTVQVRFETLEMRSYDEYISSLPQVTTLLVCGIEGGRRTALVEFPLGSALEWIDRMLGGRGTPGAVEDRELTDIEGELVGLLMGRALKDLGYSFSTLLTLDATIKSIQYAPQMVQAAAASAPVLVARFTIDVDGRECAASVMLPAEGVTAALRENQAAEEPEEDEEIRSQREALDRTAQEIPVEVSVRFRPKRVHARELTALRAGDLIALQQSASEPLEVVVGDKLLAHAAPGSEGPRLAALIVTVKENS
ncbi:MAG: flagellar motor switch protein FliM [Actinomyces sp.]|jgi:flagellar motor switch protein FliM|nr:flagellar motor switch protein FliM [Actinomyces sp.]MCI1662309.1 flagellar motor switch protein FliM [Actinomyces sp.]MCI1691771.1 flagellar motor switch protein FliM [Actinomyces sp.]MCI1787455.1 flagellar motor switch protein FliM [Actinomyces sp.]MCI1830912.1 flagellar motor switch protein FliM [Actinomyces sp.]